MIWVHLAPMGTPGPDLPVDFSEALTQGFRERPQFSIRFVVPVDLRGNTVKLHAWYDRKAKGEEEKVLNTESQP